MDFASGNQIQTPPATDALTRQLDGAKRAAGNGDATEAAQSFERLLATMLVHEMTKSLPEGFFGSGPGADTFNGWLEEHLGNSLADSGALGLTEAVRASLIRKNAGIDGGGEE